MTSGTSNYSAYRNSLRCLVLGKLLATCTSESPVKPLLHGCGPASSCSVGAIELILQPYAQLVSLSGVTLKVDLSDSRVSLSADLSKCIQGFHCGSTATLVLYRHTEKYLWSSPRSHSLKHLNRLQLICARYIQTHSTPCLPALWSKCLPHCSTNLLALAVTTLQPAKAKSLTLVRSAGGARESYAP